MCLGFLSCFFVGCQQNKKANAEETKQISKELETEAPISELEIRLKKQGLVNIQEIDSTFLVELKYASTDNFFGENVYGELRNAYLQEDVALKLKNAQAYLKEINPDLNLLIYDGVRPYSVQKILWEKLDSIPPKTREAYVANPSEGSIHNYGCAVDLTIFDNKADSTLDMGTKYDFFGHLAFPRLEAQNLRNGSLTKQQVENRKILRSVMEKAGFMPITSEWWHFNATTRKNAEKKYLIIQ